IRVIAQKQKSQAEVFGKDFFGLSTTGEYTLDLVENAIATFSEAEIQKSQPIKISENISQPLPPRPPLLCAGCPHRSTFYALKLAIPRDDASVVMCGDIGCLGLGALAPMQMIDTIHHMGMSISMAQGLSEAIDKNRNNKVVALLGDGTFFHSGVQSLLNAVYTKSNFTLIIFDNRTVGMTGHQDNPGAVHHNKYRQINIHQLVRGMGIEHVNTIDPFDLKSTYSKIKSSLEHIGISVLIASSPCVFLPEFKEGHLIKRTFKVDPTKCNSCANHCDGSEWCSKESTQKNSLVRAKAMIMGAEHIPGNEQLCPANICNHGFFNSILAGNHKEALEIVRDKILFAKVCGDICHKPCETALSSSGRVGEGRIPIRQLKHFVSNIENNFKDFSKQISRAKNAAKKNKSVAVIGAGPAGLSAAYDLVQNGYDVTMFEREENAGGMVRYIIPNFRVDKTGMEQEIEVLEKMGVKFKFNHSRGKEINVEQLSKDFDATVLAVGMWNSQSLEIIEKNISKEKRFDAISFLKMFNQKILPFGEGTGGVTILVIGGGNSAMDAARAAKKLHPANNVIVSCIEKLDDMPAFAGEISGTIKENIRIADNSFVSSANGENGRISITLNSFDKKEFIENINPDLIITAIGQKGESNLMNEKISSDENYRIEKVGYKNVFAAGDILKGNHNSLIGAVGSGKRAAVQVRSLLEDYEFEYEGEVALNRLASLPALFKGERASGKETLSPSSGRFGEGLEYTNEELLEEIKGYDLFQTCAKCNHCIDNFGCPAMLKIDGKVVIDEKRCTSCGLCLDVCPNRAIYVEEELVQLKN
ncbi:MAG: FAD-dependent oxidoreductase, partial [Bacteroidia bacterium]